MDYSSLILALIAAAPGIYAVWNQRRKTGADTAATFEGIANRAICQVEELRKRVEKLERLRARDRRTMEKWRAGIQTLIQQLIDADMTPDWTPESEPEEPLP
jgi:hypothetical protein